MNKFELNLLNSIKTWNNRDIDQDHAKEILDIVENYFNFSSMDLIMLAFKCPSIVNCDIEDFENNINQLSRAFNLKSNKIRYLILKYPFILTINASLVIYKARLLSMLMSVPVKDIIKGVYVYSDLMFLCKNQIKQQIAMLSKTLEEFGFALRKIICQNPRVMFLSESDILSLREVLMNHTLSSFEACKVLKNIPEIFEMSEKQLYNKLSFYYPRYFVKRDLKEILPSCPQLLLLSNEDFVRRFIEIQKYFMISEKETCKFIRSNPDVLFLENFDAKIKGFKKININDEFIKQTPMLFSVVEVSLPLKFVLTRILGLERYFVEICKMNTRLFISRFIHMQVNNIYSHEDLILDEESYYKKYRINSKTLLLTYKIELENIHNICKYYADLKGKLLGWTDVVFPSDIQIKYFLLEKENSDSKLLFDYSEYRQKTYGLKMVYELFKVLKGLHLNLPECKLIINKCPAILNCDTNNILKVFDTIRKNGLNFEDTLSLLIRRPILFTYSVRDFNAILEETMDYENCEVVDALNKFM